MKTNNEEKNVYVQPECEVFQVQIQQMIATSGSVSNGSNEEYEEGSTTGWF